ncbi:protein translocase subunit SecD [Leptolyngbya sp. FACHB-261]|uniref:protein translocase subunit SecD n=1 Tax=Leptolyngbya sp. FACHB-261 TaxID=2692806 RepID=UPI0016829919|nr:protein translocase subunit SecD [Leptolyngbya sp. FACHB-261]MBD2100223.1 protein translocase subunit SecD [Leptolyngbya sp. FACHB-261]
MGKQRWLIALILAILIGSVAIIARLPIRLGLDLQGGSQITLQARTTPQVPKLTPEVMEGVKSVMEQRVNGLGVTEASIQLSGNDQLLVQLPGVKDPDEAERVLGGTAQLEFRRQKPGTEAEFRALAQIRAELQAQQESLRASKNETAIQENREALQKNGESFLNLFESIGLSGKNLTGARAVAPSQGQTWSVAIEFDAEGGQKFAQLTKEIAGTGRSIGIFLDNQPISYPIVDAQYATTGISGGRAEINGRFTTEEAAALSIQLRAGSLPVPVQVVENRTVGATLGADSIRASLWAGIGGLTLVLIFMVAYYKLPGLIADLALVIYALMTFAIFVLLGVTLTLPGIAGFILSIGMAVDANVLIFERMKEELRAGKTLYRSVEAGFSRAFSSILDGNVTTLIACAALFWLGAGLVKGFALTLGLGIGVSMFTALTCSRTFLLTALTLPELRKPELFGVPKGKPASSTGGGAA